MSARTFTMSEDLNRYLLSISLRDTALLAELREQTARMPEARMQISAEQGQFLHWLVSTIGAKRTLEIGVFTGYSALVTALALPEDGEIVACDISDEYTAIARSYWERAGVSQRIHLRLAPALHTLRDVLARNGEGGFDFAFIDADKENYGAYFEMVLKLLRVGGVMAIDNVLWSGRVIDPANNESSTVALREFNRQVFADPRVAISVIPIGDGLTLARKL